MPFLWSKEKRKYYDADTGDLIPESVVRRWVDDFAAALIVRFMFRASRLKAAIVTVESDEQELRDAFLAWNDLNRDDITAGHLAATVVAFGGFNHITTEEFRTGEEAAAYQLSFWDAFVAGVVTGATAINDAFVARTGMYASAVYSTYQNAVRMRELAAGKSEERRILGAADHCIDCLEQWALGWQPIGTLKAIGDSVCRTRCRCRFQFRK